MSVQLAEESSLRFAELLRDFRLVAGLTQEELAERAGLSQRGVSDLERGTRRNPYLTTIRRLAAAMRLSAEDEAALEHAAQGRRGPARKTPPAESAPVSPTSFVGRERELALAHALLARNRMVTLTGMGGIGKTRLARKVADQAVPGMADRLIVVELVGLSEASMVPRAVSLQLGIHDEPGVPIVDRIVATIGRARVLLVLDNCEHLVGGCTPLVDTLLAGCPGLRILATSREPLGAAGESCWSVPAMGFDPSHASSPDQTRRYDAVRLFVERTRAVWPTFVLSDQNAAAVGRICRRLEGIPLAIELAAARTRVLSVDDLDARLEDRLQLLVMGPAHSDPRHQTLRAALDWSYLWLAEDEQRLFERLSVFRGGAVLEAIEAVCRPARSDKPIIDLVQSLVEKSLITADPDPDGVIRFRLLETIREYAGQHLVQRGTDRETRDQHLQFFAEFCERAKAAWRSPQEQVWLDRLEREHDNVRAALRWAEECADSVETGLRLCAALAHFWAVRGHATEGRRCLEGLFARPVDVDAAVLAAAFHAAAHLAFENGDYARASTWGKEGLALRRKLGDARGIAVSLNQLAIQAASQGRFEEAHAGFEESLATSRAAGDQKTVAAALVNLAMTARHLARFDEARTLLGQSLEQFRTLGSRTGENRTLHALGNLAVDTHDQVAAREWFRQALVLSAELRDVSSVARCLESFASLELEQADGVLAATLYGAAEALRQAIGVPATAVSQPAQAARVAQLEQMLGHKRLVAAWTRGNAMSLDRAIRVAIGKS